jgi:hypothetical protein
MSMAKICTDHQENIRFYSRVSQVSREFTEYKEMPEPGISGGEGVWLPEERMFKLSETLKSFRDSERL